MKFAGALLLIHLFADLGLAQPTFYKDIEPILAAHCQACHRTGEIAPMPLIEYKDVRPWAKAIASAVATHKMPPWFAEQGEHKLANDRHLSPAEVATILNWASHGAPEGDAADRKPVRRFEDGWNIPKPDLVVEMPNAIDIPASGKMEYQYVIVPLNLKEDRWVEAVEARPTARTHVHHAVIMVREKGSPWLRGVPPGVPVEFPSAGNHQGLGAAQFANAFHIYTPGNTPDIWEPGQARLLPAGSDLVFSMHYVPNGKAARDRTKLGIVFAKEPAKERVITLAAAAFDFAIPPGAANYAVPAQLEIPNDAKLLRFYPHMHLRGSGFEYWLLRPGASPDLLLRGASYDFRWHLTYALETPVELKRGMRIGVIGRFDNSVNNPANPDPSATVHWGEPSFDEMMSGFFDIAIDARHSMRTWIEGGPPVDAAPKSTSTGGSRN